MADFSDSDFKSIIKKNWRTYTQVFGADTDKDYWYRARPKINDEEPAAPYLAVAGLDSYKTLPDALYVRFSRNVFCDVIAIEACTSKGNFNDKRSRYGASTQSNVLRVNSSWLKTRRKIKNAQKMMHEYLDIDNDILSVREFMIPIRGLNVLYVLQDYHHNEVKERYFPQHHEYFISWGDLRGLSDTKTREFLQALDLKTHFSSNPQEKQMSDTYDVLIIGAGPGGYVTAIRAAQLGFKTAVVDREHLGGICLNWGCIPTKALLRSAEIFHYFQHPGDYGLTAEKVGFDVGAIVKRSRGVSARLNGGVGMLLKKNKVDVIWGEASVDSVAKGNQPGQVTVKESTRAEAPKGAKAAGTYGAKHIIVATGARPRALPGIEPDRKQIWTYYEAMVPETMPKSLLVMGSGAIGIEFASFYRTMGAEVTVVEVLPQILPVEDAEIAGMARKRFEKQGIKILTGTKVTKVEKGADSVTATIEASDGKTQQITAEKLISAVGVVGNIENLGLEKLGVKTDRGCVVTDGLGRTNVLGLYAIGDVAGPPMLAHKAEHEGVICIETIKGLHTHPMDKGKIPGCTYCQPQIASVGLTEAKAKEQGFAVKVGRFPFAGNGKAIALGEPDGMIKTVFDAKTGQLLGAHMVGAEVTELIQGYVVAMNLESTEEELMHTVFPHPTLSEMMHESVLDAYGRVIHS